MGSNGSLHIHYNLLSQPSRAVFMFCKKAGIDFVPHDVDLGNGEHKKQKYKDEVNFFQQVPAIVDDKFPLSECSAILTYLANKKGATVYLGKTDKDQARVNQFMSWQQSGLRSKCIAVFIPTLKDRLTIGPFTQADMDVEKVKAAREEVKQAVKQLVDFFLAGKDFIGGSSLSIADIMGFCELQQLYAVCDEDLYNSNPKAKAWMERVGKALEPGVKEGSALVEYIRGEWSSKPASKGAQQMKK